MGTSNLQPIGQKQGDNLGWWLASELGGGLGHKHNTVLWNRAPLPVGSNAISGYIEWSWIVDISTCVTELLIDSVESPPYVIIWCRAHWTSYKVKVKVTQSCPTLATPWIVACQAPVCGIFQARILEWVAISKNIQKKLSLSLLFSAPRIPFQKATVINSFLFLSKDVVYIKSI